MPVFSLPPSFLLIFVLHACWRARRCVSWTGPGRNRMGFSLSVTDRTSGPSSRFEQYIPTQNSIYGAKSYFTYWWDFEDGTRNCYGLEMRIPGDELRFPSKFHYLAFMRQMNMRSTKTIGWNLSVNFGANFSAKSYLTPSFPHYRRVRLQWHWLQWHSISTVTLFFPKKLSQKWTLY